ncbi:MAG: PH domain-containing protein, partial [Thermomicrobiales bacterium]
MSSDDRRFRDDDRRDSQRSGQPRADAGGSGVAPPRSPPGSRDVWRASASFGWLIGVTLLLLIGSGIVLLLARVPSSTGGQRVAWVLIAVVLTALAIGVTVLLRALPTMRYQFADDALVVEWIGRQRVVPLAEIEDVTFDPHQPLRLPRWEPFWPGYYVATVRTPSGTWHTWATQQPRRRVRLTTAHGIVAISPERPVRFVAELERRRRTAGQTTVPDANAAHADSP